MVFSGKQEDSLEIRGWGEDGVESASAEASRKCTAFSCPTGNAGMVSHIYIPQDWEVGCRQASQLVSTKFTERPCFIRQQPWSVCDLCVVLHGCLHGCAYLSINAFFRQVIFRKRKISGQKYSKWLSLVRKEVRLIITSLLHNAMSTVFWASVLTVKSWSFCLWLLNAGITNVYHYN